MASRNDVTGDLITSRKTSNAYRDNYDAIFRKKDTPAEEAKLDLSKLGIPADGTGTLPSYDDPRWANKSSEKVEEEIEEAVPYEFRGLTFSLTAEEEEKVNNWLYDEVYPPIVAKQKEQQTYAMFIGKDHKGREYPYTGAIGGGLTYQFTPTSLGVITTVTYGDKKLDLTDYNCF